MEIWLIFCLQLFTDTNYFSDRKKERKLKITSGHWLSKFELRIIDFFNINNSVSSFNTEKYKKEKNLQEKGKICR